MTPYTGNPTATQAPSGPPDGGSPPIVNLPQDTDPPNGATFVQAYKVLADFVAFLLAPFAHALAWAQAIVTFTDARGHKRSEVDHWGMFRSNTVGYSEDFTPAPSFNATGTGSVTAGRWEIVTLGGGALTSSVNPGSTYANPPFPAALAGTVASHTNRQFAGVVDGGTGGNRTELRLNDNNVTACWADDVLFSAEWDFQNFTNLSVLWVLGYAGPGEFVNNIQNGAFFIRPDTPGTNWKCRTIVGGVNTEVDSGILAGTVNHVFQIEFAGANISDDNTARVIFKIDGAVVANITTHIPNNAGILAIPTCGGVCQSSVTNPIFLLNRVGYRQPTRIALP